MKTERVQEQKDKMQVELQAMWTEQCDQMKKKKEQFATEVGAKQKTCSNCLLLQIYFPLKLKQQLSIVSN